MISGEHERSDVQFEIVEARHSTIRPYLFFRSLCVLLYHTQRFIRTMGLFTILTTVPRTPTNIPASRSVHINLNQYSLCETSRECHRSAGCYTFATESYRITCSQILVPDRSMEMVLFVVFSRSLCLRSFHIHQSGDSWIGSPIHVPKFD